MKLASIEHKVPLRNQLARNNAPAQSLRTLPRLRFVCHLNCSQKPTLSLNVSMSSTSIRDSTPRAKQDNSPPFRRKGFLAQASGGVTSWRARG